MKNRFENWLLRRKWLWRKVVFDNGIVGKNYHRYDHVLLPYAQGMGDNGKDGGKTEAIELTLRLKALKYDKQHGEGNK